MLKLFYLSLWDVVELDSIWLNVKKCEFKRHDYGSMFQLERLSQNCTPNSTSVQFFFRLEHDNVVEKTYLLLSHSCQLSAQHGLGRWITRRSYVSSSSQYSIHLQFTLITSSNWRSFFVLFGSVWSSKKFQLRKSTCVLWFYNLHSMNSLHSAVSLSSQSPHEIQVRLLLKKINEWCEGQLESTTKSTLLKHFLFCL